MSHAVSKIRMGGIIFSMKIEKKQINSKHFLTKQYYYNTAREGMNEFSKQLKAHNLIDKILLPGYIGISPKEGSGIFDSVKTIDGIQIEYYRMDRELNIVLSDLRKKIADGRSLVILVNYFGFRDVNFNEVCRSIKEKSGYILEDNAHGLFTYYRYPNYYADATIFSLHKMFPFSKGGCLCIRNLLFDGFEYTGKDLPDHSLNPFLYDFNLISEARSRNYRNLYGILRAYGDEHFTFLRGLERLESAVPQTFPIVLKNANRDRIYEIMNEKGYGVVSLYHTLIDPLQSSENEDTVWLSKHIINLPVHQDVNIEEYPELVETLIQACRNS